MAFPWGRGGGLGFDLNRGVLPEPRKPYPFLRVIFAKKGTLDLDHELCEYIESNVDVLSREGGWCLTRSTMKGKVCVKETCWCTITPNFWNHAWYFCFWNWSQVSLLWMDIGLKGSCFGNFFCWEYTDMKQSMIHSYLYSEAIHLWMHINLSKWAGKEFVSRRFSFSRSISIMKQS